MTTSTPATMVVATDGSHAATQAVDLAIDLAAQHHEQLVFVHVLPALDLISDGDGEGEAYASPYQPTSRDLAVLVTAAEAAAARGVPATTELLAGDPTDEILAAAERFDATLTVLGSRGRGRLVSALLGSVSHGVLRRSRRPVLVVRGDLPTWVPARVPRSAAMIGTTEPRRPT